MRSSQISFLLIFKVFSLLIYKSATKMNTNKMQSVFEVASNVISENAKGIASANKEAMSFNRVIRVMKSKGVYDHIASALASVGINKSNELTLKNIKTLIVPELQKTVTKKVDGEEKEQTVVCTIRKRYETDTVFVCDKQGRKLCKTINGKVVPRTQKVVRLDEDGERVIKDYTLCEVKAWNIALVITLLAQSKAIREGVE